MYALMPWTSFLRTICHIAWITICGISVFIYLSEAVLLLFSEFLPWLFGLLLSMLLFWSSCWYKHLVSPHCGHKTYFIWFSYSLNLKNHFVVQEIFDPWMYHVCFTEIIWISFHLLDGMIPTCLLEAFCILWFGSS